MLLVLLVVAFHSFSFCVALLFVVVSFSVAFVCTFGVAFVFGIIIIFVFAFPDSWEVSKTEVTSFKALSRDSALPLKV